MSEIYELEPEIPKPKLPGSVIVQSNEGDVADALARDLYHHALNCVRSFGDFHMALSGGQTPLKLYQTLIIDPLYRDMPWKRTHIWIVSETDIDLPAMDTIHETLVLHGDVPKDQFHPMQPEHDDADARYTSLLQEHLGWREKGHDRLDFVLLGLGQDGSTAGYPANEPMPDPQELLAHLGSSDDIRTLSLSMRMINAARLVAIVATGKHKQACIRCITQLEPHTLPIGYVRPVGGSLKWYLDESACPASEGSA